MANLSRNQALELIKAPKNAREINKAKQKRIRHRLHTEAEVEPVILTEPHMRFLQWISNVLRSEDNFERFKQLYRPPVVTNELVESIFSEFEKVFEAQNSYEKFEFTDPELVQDFEDYRDRIQDFNFWETQGFETFKNSIDNILVIDLPKISVDAEGNLLNFSNRPEPYYYILDIDNLLDIENTRVKATDTMTGKKYYFFKTEYLIFRGEAGAIYVFDDTFWREYVQAEAGGEIVFRSEYPHNLGYCPARSFWTTPLNSKTTLLKSGPITNNLSDLDWYLAYSIFERYLQLYAPFPIYAIYKTKCSYKEEGGNKRECVNGFLEVKGSRFVGEHREACPRCKEKIKVGPGNILMLAMPQDKDQPDAMANPMKVIPAERESLDYIRTTVREMKKDIFVSCVGRSQDPQNNQAQNEKQVESGTQFTESMLMKVKRNFEIIHTFALDTIARLRYEDAYISGLVSYGDKFFFADESKEIGEYKSAVENGLPEWDLSMRRTAINDARYRNDPKAKERIKVLENLLPFPDYTLEKLRELRKDAPELVTIKDLIIKIKFNEFIQRFEREQTNLIQFGALQSFDKKISLIREELSRYADEYIEQAEKDKPKKDPAPVPPPGPGFPVPPAPDPIPEPAPVV